MNTGTGTFLAACVLLAGCQSTETPATVGVEGPAGQCAAVDEFDKLIARVLKLETTKSELQCE